MKCCFRALLFSSLLFTSSLSLASTELDKKHAYQDTLEWNSDLPKDVLDLLHKGLFQEAIWMLEESNQRDDADDIKRFLRHLLERSDFQDIVPLGGGVTDTKLVYLPYGVKAVLKKKSVHPSSNYRSEIGAYLVDQLGGFSLVPMTVKRSYNGVSSSLQYFVKGAKDATKIPYFQKSAKLNIFDYLIRNQDRTLTNVLVVNKREVAIDHGLALRPGSVLGAFLRFTDKTRKSLGIEGDPIRIEFAFPDDNIEAFRADKSLLNRLRNLSLANMTERLHPTLSNETITVIWEKNQKLLRSL